MREVEILCNLEELSFDNSTKSYSIDTTQFDLENPKNCSITDCSVVFDSKKGYVVICSDELYSRRKVCQNSTKFGSSILTLDSKNVFEYDLTVSSGTLGGDTDIEANTDLIMWVDYAPSRFLNNTFQQVSTVGDVGYYVYNRSPAPASLMFTLAYGNGLALSNWGTSGGKGLTKTGSWQSIVDSTSPQPSFAEEWTLHMSFTAPANITDTHNLVEIVAPGSNHLLRIDFSSGGVIRSWKSPGGATALTNLSWIPLQNYILSCTRRVGTQDNTGDGSIDDYEFFFSFKHLETGAVTTEIAPRSVTLNPTAFQYFRFGRANLNFNVVQGPCIMYNSPSTDRFNHSVAWIESVFTGDTQVSQSATKYYAYNTENVLKIPFKKNCQTISKLDFQFKDELNAVIVPTRGLVKVKFEL